MGADFPELETFAAKGVSLYKGNGYMYDGHNPPHKQPSSPAACQPVSPSAHLSDTTLASRFGPIQSSLDGVNLMPFARLTTLKLTDMYVRVIESQ